ncbi:tetratricopeptide repeat protein [Noviherbaspirillum sp. CPCC 100848]|uniref:Tetratricopeptide repeat protein n=1 Tax=Noviherbaspirillum album TaxID=3080276 RepID=A0ABU6JCG7_9BURK|nr:tetratricopeptide repeat protein [Noviherbaspirillum sp. CPCC 100848]MEC4721336.1 tetratricopeptide repeat protein [Noviherbaspirillum sp. CPCC 100848]
MPYANNNNVTEADIIFHKAFTAHQAGNLSYAEKMYRKALKKAPWDSEILYLLGTACSQLKKWKDAGQYLERALKIKPDYPEALNNLGQTLSETGMFRESVEYFEKALLLFPDYADVHSNIGGALRKLGEIERAEKHLRRAIEIEPNLANAHYFLGLVLNEQDRFSEAAASFSRGLELRPDNEMAYCDLGIIYKIWGRYEEACACFRRALEINPEYSSAINNLGAVFEEMGRLEDALSMYDLALKVCPENITAEWNKAFLFLRQGVLDKGWRAYEQRFDVGMATKRFSDIPEWNGASLRDATILVYAEQGLGDEILFASCFPDVIEQSKHCIIECAPRLASLFARSFPKATVKGSVRGDTNWLAEVPNVDLQVAAGSLPRFIRPTLKSFPETPSYLVPDPKRTLYWRSRLADIGPGMKIGICWRSGLLKGERLKQYSQLTQWGEIFRTPGVHFVNLQYDECTEELKQAEEMFGIKISTFPEIDLRNAIDDSAALTAAMDLVITAGTAVAEMAGAIGVDVYRLDFYGRAFESLGTDGMPWHPSMTLFGQTKLGVWDETLALVAQALGKKLRKTGGLLSSATEELEYKKLNSGIAGEYVCLSNNVEVAVDGFVEDMPTYVLNELHGWFDPEYDFVVRIAEVGMKSVDIDAGIGIYSVPLAQRSSDGCLWARTATVKEASLMRESVLRNRLENRVHITTAMKDSSLDPEMDLYELEGVEFMRVSADATTLDLFVNSPRFFSVNSPLLMFGIKSGVEFDSSVTDWLSERGFRLYQLIPGLGVLIPFLSSNDLDAYALNLFACRSERSEVLERQGLLVNEIKLDNHNVDPDPKYWQEYLNEMPYASGRIEEWSSGGNKDKQWELYYAALNAYSFSKNIVLPPPARVAYLQIAASLLSTLLRENANLPRLLSFCRVLSELGKREATVLVLNKLCELLHSGMSKTCHEPFLALSESFSQTFPGCKFEQWTIAMILAQREHLRAFSTFFTMQESLPVFEEIKALGFLDKRSERSMQLIKKRYSL